MNPRRPQKRFFDGVDLKTILTAIAAIATAGSSLQCAKQAERADAAVAYGESAEAVGSAGWSDHDSLVAVIEERDLAVRRLTRQLRACRSAHGAPSGPIRPRDDYGLPEPRRGLTQGATAVPRVVVGWLKSLFTVPARDRRG